MGCAQLLALNNWEGNASVYKQSEDNQLTSHWFINPSANNQDQVNSLCSQIDKPGAYNKHCHILSCQRNESVMKMVPENVFKGIKIINQSINLSSRRV